MRFLHLSVLQNPLPPSSSPICLRLCVSRSVWPRRWLVCSISYISNKISFWKVILTWPEFCPVNCHFHSKKWLWSWFQWYHVLFGGYLGRKQKAACLHITALATTDFLKSMGCCIVGLLSFPAICEVGPFPNSSHGKLCRILWTETHSFLTLHRKDDLAIQMAILSKYVTNTRIFQDKISYHFPFISGLADTYRINTQKSSEAFRWPKEHMAKTESERSENVGYSWDED